MTPVNEMLRQIANARLTHNERAQLRCQLAKQLEDSGNYEAAREAMGDLWSRVGERPMLGELDSATAAEVLLRVGALTGWLGSAKQIPGSQELAKNLIIESVEKFSESGDKKKFAEAQMELAPCYWREGSPDEARVVLHEALSQTDEKDGDLRANILLRLATIEAVMLRLSDALHLLIQAAPLFDASVNHNITTSLARYLRISAQSNIKAIT
jgi:tetratricopeptide (TPR) repeat protein